METVLFTESSMNVGGQERQFFQQMEELKNLGIQSVLACKRNSQVYEFAKNINVEIFTFSFRGSLDLKTIFGLRKLIKTRKIKACVCHSGHDTNTLGIAVKTLINSPRIVRSRAYTGRVSSFVYNWLLDQTMVPSDYMRGTLLANPKIDPSKIKVVYPGIDFEKLEKDAQIPVDFSLNQWISQNDGALLLQIGMLRSGKGHLTSLDAIHQLQKNYGHKNIRFLIAGSGSMIDAINHRIEQYELQDVVRIQEFHHIGSVLKKADLVLMPSNNEALGMAQIEALGLGIPVIASHVGGISETITHLETGILVEPGNVAEWAKWIDYALNNKEAMKKMALRGQQFVLEHFSKQKNTEELLKILGLDDTAHRLRVSTRPV